MNYKYIDVLTCDVTTEWDIKHVFKRTIILCELAGMKISDRTAFSSATSKLTRNAVLLAGKAAVTLRLEQKFSRVMVLALITDSDKRLILDDEGKDQPAIEATLQLVATAKAASDFYNCTTDVEGTTVTIGRSTSLPALIHKIQQLWNNFLSEEANASPSQELKQKTLQLFQLSEQLKAKDVEIKHQANEIKRLNAQIDAFSYIVSHDLKSPLKNIEGLLPIMKESIGPFQDAEGLFDMLQNSLNKMNKLISDVFIYSKFGIDNVTKTHVDVKNLVREIMNTIANPKGLAFELGSVMPVLYCEESYLSQIFIHLVGNAVKFHDLNEGLIKVHCAEIPKNFLFTITDDGPGIISKEQSKIFRIFYTTHWNSTDSSGLGLAIVKKIVEMKGGKVWVESYGRGSKFSFTWPIKEATYLQKS